MATTQLDSFIDDLQLQTQQLEVSNSVHTCTYICMVSLIPRLSHLLPNNSTYDLYPKAEGVG